VSCGEAGQNQQGQRPLRETAHKAQTVNLANRKATAGFAALDPLRRLAVLTESSLSPIWQLRIDPSKSFNNEPSLAPGGRVVRLTNPQHHERERWKIRTNDSMTLAELPKRLRGPRGTPSQPIAQPLSVTIGSQN
jgi:hypothetical protein